MNVVRETSAPVRALKHAQGGRGVYEAGNGVSISVLEDKRSVVLKPPRKMFPANLKIDDRYESGPVFVSLVQDGFFSPKSGFSYLKNGAVLRESLMRLDYVEQAQAEIAGKDLKAIPRINDRNFVNYLVTNQRIGNYCRWWLDTMAKFFLFDRVGPLPGLSGFDRGVHILPPFDSKYQPASVSLIGAEDFTKNYDDTLLAGNFLVSSGLTYGGGQNISTMVADFRSYLLGQPSVQRAIAPYVGKSPRLLYVSRAKTSMRRLIGEEQLTERLSDIGFEVAYLEEWPLAQQVAAFSEADVIVSPHGAGLTNMIFARPASALVEIFSKDGVHTSSFRRISNAVGADYYLYAGESVDIRAAKGNKNNFDIQCDIKHLFEFIKDVAHIYHPK